MKSFKHQRSIWNQKKPALSPSQIIVLGFLTLIFVGALLLSLPIASAKGEATDFLDAVFTSTSAVCVTGLVVRDTGTYWSFFGKTVIILLIQVGGLGFMSLATVGAILMGKKIGFRERMLIQESLNQNRTEGIVRLSRNIFLGTLLIEAAGALLLSLVFVPDFGLKKGIAYGIFHSISAFCNAGFDLMGNYGSMVRYVSNPLLNFTLMGLIITGGLGFAVIFELMRKERFRKLSLHSVIVLTMTAVLILIPFVLFFIMEHDNPETVGSMNFVEKSIAILFQTVSPRTAGFNTLPLDSLRDGSKFLTVLLMFVGGSPASTAGGVKTVTLAVLLLAVGGLITGKKELEVRKRRISHETINKSLTVVVLGMTFLLTGTMLLSMTEIRQDFLSLLFEAGSAAATVGLTLGITPMLSSAGKLIVILLMFSGRVGALTILLALSGREKPQRYRFAEEKVIVG